MRFFTLAGYLVALSLCVAVFACNAQVSGMKQDLARIEQRAAVVSQDLHMLDAEWAYLTRPQRLQQFAGVYLDIMQPVNGEQLAGSLEALPAPAVAEAPAAFQVSAVSPLVGALDFRQ